MLLPLVGLLLDFFPFGADSFWAFLFLNLNKMKNNLPEPEKIKALSQFLECSHQKAKKVILRGDYEVLDEYEAIERWENEIYEHIDDVIFKEIPSQYHKYFDKEKYRRENTIDAFQNNTVSLYEEWADGETYVKNSLYCIFKKQ